ncbi:Hint domain-containing protein [Epibacterium ulvae]|uniref:Hint domain-containing protein n=1 Tax=Epibacterium ulvae TaxID=1156985 RepID=UPI001BFC81C8|nr:Hint domain-containing protein [Epibacterium ulvae]MBT8152363.1 Hint domain-containing protein [Epibacterium ulvae]
MFLDHFNAFANHQPIEIASDLPAALFATTPSTTPRPRIGGLLPHTLVEAENGFLQARQLKAGDMVHTFDGGVQEVVAVKQSVPRLTPMMHVPAGALGNDRDMDLPSDHVIALDEDTAEQLFDVPVVLAKLVSLAGFNGITPAMPQRLARIHVTFAEEELIWSECGMLLHMADDSDDDSAYWMLSLTESRELVATAQERSLPEASEIVEQAASGTLDLPLWLRQLSFSNSVDLAA